MGGFGSGRWNQHNKKRIVEDCWMLDLADFPLGAPTNEPPCGVFQAVRINGGEFPLPVHYALTEEEDASFLDITYPRGTRESPEHVNERIKLLGTRPNYGGARWYFSCPFIAEGERCDNRVRILYLPPGERDFGCRKCHDLTYESSQTNHKYDGLYALMAGGEREGEIFEFLKGAFSYHLREARREKAQGQTGWLDAYERYFWDDL